MSSSSSVPAAGPALREGGRILVDQLKIHGTSRLYGVPGESFLPVLDALCDVPMPFITCRHEGAAAVMAEAEGKLTGRPGVAFVTRGPGACNASSGVHIAHQDSTPMILFIGQVGSSAFDREAFQEVEFRTMFAPLCKWVAQIDRADRIPEYVSRAFYTATSGRPGPVVLALPEDVLSARLAVADARPYVKVEPHATADDVNHTLRLLAGARQPLLIVGGGGWTQQASHDLQRFVETHHLPVVASFRCQDYLDNDHPLYVGDLGLSPNPNLAARIRDADFILLCGARLGEASSRGYTLLDVPTPRQTLVHVYPDPNELGRVYQPDLAINASAPAFFAAAAAAVVAPAAARAVPVAETKGSERHPVWSAFAEEARAAYLEWQRPKPGPGTVQLADIVTALRQELPAETIVTNGAGNYTVWVHRYHRYTRFRTQLGPTSGSMGYGLPAAIAASLLEPERPVIAFAGDGCFMMHAPELATAVQYGAKPIVVVVNNGTLGTIRTHQERRYPGRVSATDLFNPDFAALARACGAHGETVTRTEEFSPALERCRQANKAALIELRLDPEALTPSATLSQIRQSAQRG